MSLSLQTMRVNEREIFKFPQPQLIIPVQLLKAELTTLSQSDEPNKREQFLEIYANLLTSNISDDNNNRAWINEPLVQPLLDYLRTCIPVKIGQNFRTESDSKRVFIKETVLPFEPKDWEIDMDWFYWEDTHLTLAALFKLNIKTFDIMIFGFFKLVHFIMVETKFNLPIVLVLTLGSNTKNLRL